jgi:hypothetical protein
MQHNPGTLTDEEMHERYRLLREQFEKDEDEFDARLWSQLKKRMTDPVSSKVYLFAECLRIVSEMERDRDEPDAPPEGSELAVLRRLRRYDSLILEAEFLFQKAVLSRVLRETAADQVRAATDPDQGGVTREEVEELGKEIGRRARVAEAEAAKQNHK